MLPVDRFLAFIRQHDLVRPSDKVLLAVSGGRDSVLMTHLFNEAGLSFGIAHCNFNLRGTESDEDENFVRSLARQFSVSCHTVTFQTAEYAGANQISIQMAARELRYQWFERIRKEQGYRYVAVAHHQSDATETVLLNLVRGTGIAGLHGILPQRGDIIRPMLFLSSEEIRTIVNETNIPYREDSSNLSAKYARNKIRLKVIPHLKELNPYLDETFAANSKRFEELEQFLNSQIAGIRKDLFSECGTETVIRLESLKPIHPRQLLLFELFKPYGFSESVLGDLQQAWDGPPGKIFESSTHTLLLDRGQLILRPKHRKPFREQQIDEAQREISWQSFHFKACFSTPSETTIIRDPRTAYFDAALLHFPLTLRLWKKGDYFYPFGMNGKKKLSDFFTGQKLSLFGKEDVPVVENGNGDIIWVAGFRSDNRYKITPHTKKVYILELHK